MHQKVEFYYFGTTFECKFIFLVLKKFNLFFFFDQLANLFNQANTK